MAAGSARCRQRGGCFNCSAGEYDSDGVPTHACEKCPEGKTSEEGADTCTDVEPDLWEELAKLDEQLQGPVGVSAVAALALCSSWSAGCAAREQELVGGAMAGLHQRSWWERRRRRPAGLGAGAGADNRRSATG